jgi:hypothetical protein
MAKLEWQPFSQRRRFLPRRNIEAVRRCGECISVLRGLCRRIIRGCLRGRSELHLTMLWLVIEFVRPREPCTLNTLPRAWIIWALERSDDKTQYSVPDILIMASPVYWSCPHSQPDGRGSFPVQARPRLAPGPTQPAQWVRKLITPIQRTRCQADTCWVRISLEIISVRFLLFYKFVLGL